MWHRLKHIDRTDNNSSFSVWIQTLLSFNTSGYNYFYCKQRCACGESGVAIKMQIRTTFANRCTWHSCSAIFIEKLESNDLSILFLSPYRSFFPPFQIVCSIARTSETSWNALIPLHVLCYFFYIGLQFDAFDYFGLCDLRWDCVSWSIKCYGWFDFITTFDVKMNWEHDITFFPFSKWVLFLRLFFFRLIRNYQAVEVRRMNSNFKSNFYLICFLCRL